MVERASVAGAPENHAHILLRPLRYAVFKIRCDEAQLLQPVVRVRRSNDYYILTYKGKGMMVREEYNLPLNEEAFLHLKEKIDGRLIQKRRYLIPLAPKYTIELDVFEGDLAPLLLAEVEFETEEEANNFTPPEWFGEDVTFSGKYHNSQLSKLP